MTGPDRMISKLSADHQIIYLSFTQNLRANVLGFMPTHIKYFNDHGVEHISGVLKELDRMIPEKFLKNMSSTEVLLLLCATWIHDLGLLVNRDNKGNSLDDSEIRKRHHILGRDLVIEKYQLLGLQDKNLANWAAQIAHCHRRSIDIKKYFSPDSQSATWQQYLGYEFFRPVLLGGLLRLADALDTTYHRAPNTIPQIMDLPELAQLHWKASELYEGIGYDIGKGEIILDAHYSTAEDLRIVKWRFQDIKEEYESIRDILIENKLLYYELICRARKIPNGEREMFTSRMMTGSEELPLAVRIIDSKKNLSAYLENKRYVLAADVCSEIANLYDPSENGNNTLQWYRQGLDYLKSEEKERMYSEKYNGPYFLKTLQKYYMGKIEILLGKPLSDVDKNFMDEINYAFKTLDYLEGHETKFLESIYNSTAFGRSPNRKSVKIALENIKSNLDASTDGSLHNGCLICTATAVVEGTLSGNDILAQKALGWLKLQREKSWRGTSDGILRIQYCAIALDALVISGELELADNLVKEVLDSKDEWESGCERNYLETVGQLFHSISIYFRTKKSKSSNNLLKRFKKEIEWFYVTLVSESDQQQIGGLRGLLVGDLCEEGLRKDIEKLAFDIHTKLVKDPVWDPVTGGWGNDLIITMYRLYTKLSFLEYSLRMASV